MITYTHLLSFKSNKVFVFDEQTKRKVKIYNPQTQSWKRHFSFSRDKSIIKGKTACGRATVEELNINSVQAVTARILWIKAGWYPPKDL